MAKSTDLSPKFASLPSAATSLYQSSVNASYANPMASSAGGIQTNSASFRRGSGNNVYGVDVSGLWMGAADFKNAPFTVDYSGQQTIKATDGSGNTSFFNAEVLGFSVGTKWSIIIGDPTKLPTL